MRKEANITGENQQKDKSSYKEWISKNEPSNQMGSPKDIPAKG